MVVVAQINENQKGELSEWSIWKTPLASLVDDIEVSALQYQGEAEPCA